MGLTALLAAHLTLHRMISLSSHLTLKGLLSSVSLDVPLEGAFVNEGLGAVVKGTLVDLGFLTHVRLLVASKAAHVRKTLLAYITPAESNKSLKE